MNISKYTEQKTDNVSLNRIQSFKRSIL